MAGLAEKIDFLRAENLFLLDRVDDAAAAYQAHLAAYSKSSEITTVRLRLGHAHYRKKRWKEAAQAYQAAIAKNPKRAGLFLHLDFYAGECAAATEQPDPAIAHFQKFLAGTPADTLQARHRAVQARRVARREKSDRLRPSSVTRNWQAGTRIRRIARRRSWKSGALQTAPATLAKGQARPNRIRRANTPRIELRSQAEYYLGYVALSEKRDPDARKHFAAVSKAPEAMLHDAGFQAGLLAVDANDLNAAAKNLAVLATAKFESAKLNELRFRLGIAYARAKNWAEARKNLETLAAANPEPKIRAQARYELAWCCKELGDDKAAAANYAQLLADDADSALTMPATLELAEIEYEAGNAASAATRLKPLVASQDQSLAARAAYRLGWCQVKAGEFADAAASFELVHAKSAKVPDLAAPAAYQAGEARRELDEYPAAIANYTRAAEIKPAADQTHIPEQALLRLTETLALNGQYTESLAACERFSGQFPQSSLLRRVKFARGWALENLSRHAEAIAAYQAVLAGAEPDETAARAQFQIGECHLAANNLDQAIKELVKVEVNFAKNAWTPKALLEIGTALERKSDPANARARYEEVLAQFPDSPSAQVAKTRLEALSRKK